MACWCSAPAGAGPRSSRPEQGVPATATHYDILGVAPDASHDEVKRAYTRQAFRWHPDRRDDLDDAAREQADWRMRECNAAWAALGTPVGRAAYDDELRASGLLPARPEDARPATASVGAGSGASRAATVVGRVPSPTEHLVEPARDFGVLAPRRSHAGRWIALGVVVVVVGLGVIAAIAADQDRDRAPADPELRTNAFEVGSCVTILPGQTVVEVPCNQPNAGQIVATTDYPRPCPTGTQTFSLIDESLNLCLRRT